MAVIVGSKGLLIPCDSSPYSAELKVAKQILAGEADLREVLTTLSSQPLAEIGIETNAYCNLKCDYCYLDARPVSKPVPLPIVEDFIRQAVDAGIGYVAFVAKEPMNDDRAVTAMEGVRSLPGVLPRLGAVTNGTFLRRHLARIGGLSPVCVNLDISLDGLEASNDNVRGTGSFALALGAIQEAIKVPNVTTIVASVLHSRNSSTIGEFVKFLSNRGVSNFHFSPVQNLTGLSVIDNMTLSPRVIFGSVLKQLQDLAFRNPATNITLELLPDLAWQGILNGDIDLQRVRVDARGVSYLQPEAGVSFFIKLILIPPHYWRSVRLTHDGLFVPSADKVSLPDYPRFSVGSISDRSFDDLRNSSTTNGWFTRDIQRFLAMTTQAVHRRLISGIMPPRALTGDSCWVD